MKYLEDKNPRFSNGKTPLHLAAHHGHFKICKYILNNIVDKNPNDDFGITPLEIADSNNKTEVCQLITGKSLAEALIFASTNSQYDNRLFIELRVQYMKIPSLEHVVYTNCFLFWFDIQNNLCTQHVLLTF